jgi:H+/Cl- antiporter ClcA
MNSTTVAPRRLHARYYQSLAWLDQTIGRWFQMLPIAVVGTLAVIAWLFFRDQPKRETNPYGPFDMIVDLLAFNSKFAAPILLVLAVLSLLTWLASWPARRSGKIVRIDPKVMDMWVSRLGKHGLTSERRRATHWLTREKPEALIAEYKAWAEAEDAANSLSNYNLLGDSLDILTRRYKAQRNY